MSDLSVVAVERALGRIGALRSRSITVAAVTTSTNDDARAAAVKGAPSGAVFLADAQTRGRGRGDHRWHSPAGENLYLSIIARPAVPASSIAPATLAIGAAVAEMIAEHLGGATPVMIKWPNDVLASGRKIAGVLVEGQLRGSEVVSLVIGVGLNVRTISFPEDIAAHATSLALLGSARLDRSELAAALVASIDVAIRRFEERRLEGFMDTLMRRDALLGVRVESGALRGVVAGIDADGRLLVRGDDGALAAVSSGEILVESKSRTL